VQGGNIALKFNAVAHETTVYFDGKEIARHYGGFLPFHVFLHDVTPGEHNLVLRVNNVHNQIDTIPQARTDWFHYGGIIRDVELFPLEKLFVEHFHLGYTLSEQRVELKPVADIYSYSPNAMETELIIRTGQNQQLFSKQVTLQPGQNTLELGSIILENVEHWDMDHPCLYSFTLDAGQDDYTERTGFRTVSKADGAVYVNNRPVTLCGVNRHEEHPDWGFAFPDKLLRQDVEILRKMGCNSVRNSHHTPGEAFLDLCDQFGILVWDEIPMSNFSEEQLANETVIRRAASMVTEMVERDFNRPSVIIWSLLNECDTRTEAGHAMVKLLADKVRAVDRSRLITYATCEPLTDICYQLVDLVCINQYFGWYSGTPEDWNQFLAALRNKMKADGVSDHPMIISEYGAAGIYGDRGFEPRKWSEQYQSTVVEYATDLFLREKAAGMFIWQFCDARTCKQNDATRARSFNNKGILNEYRKPKQAFWAVKKLYESYHKS